MQREKFLPELMAEKDTLDPSFVHAARLLTEEIEQFQNNSTNSEEEKQYLDVISNKNIKLAERVLIPVKQYPKFNFVGKLLGPRGNSLKRLQEETGAKMSILGKGSMRDKAKDYNDEIRQEQLRELSYLNGSEESPRGRGTRGRGIRSVLTPTARGRASALLPGRGIPVPRGTHVARGAPSLSHPVRGTPAPRSRGGPGASGYRPPPPPEEDTYDEYGYDDGYGGEYDEQSYDTYDNSYASQVESGPEYYDYGHGTSEEIYDSYGQEEWVASRPSLKAPIPRSRGTYREHPYGRY
ncbi:KH domain-containing, RNA-binding, signal transduction-associated protein 2-like isoform X4 [Scyliorhinus torazame]|uniref:KH domain-containing, RNA-binding, signal transduction-associated protein 2-like isoform X4 n=1 Tax=Scyliorhinus torazame TaxID=75743 RepID=UPI003B5949D9